MFIVLCLGKLLLNSKLTDFTWSFKLYSQFSKYESGVLSIESLGLRHKLAISNMYTSQKGFQGNN